MSTGMIALVRGVIAARSWSGSIVKSSSTSTMTTSAPRFIAQSAVAL